MIEKLTPTEGGGSVEYNKEMKAQMVPRNISPELMNKHKAMVFRTVMTGGFSINPELAGWSGYTVEKKKLLVSGLDDLDDVRFVINQENDNEILAACIRRKEELETVAKMAIVPVK